MRTRAVAIVGVATLWLLGAPGAVQADYDPIGSGTTTLALDKRFLSFLKAHRVKLMAKAGATRSGRTVRLPVSGGEMDPTTGKGTIEHEGTLLFVHGKRTVPLRFVTLKVKPTPLQAKVGGSQLKVAKAKKIATKRAGFGTIFSAKGLSLSSKVITRLGKKLRLRKALEAGQPFASLRSKTQPTTLAVLPQGRATLVLDPGLVSKLNSLFVSINPIFPAELAPGSVFSFPIILGGALSPDASQGTLRTAGAIEFLQQGAGQVFVTEFWFEMGSRAALAELDIEPTPTFRGKLGQLGALAIGPGSIASDARERTISVTGAPLALSDQTAAAFNEGFAEGKATFGAGEAFGVLTFNAQTQ